MAFALPLSTRIGIALAVVNDRMKRWVARAVSIGLAIAKFFGTSSPNTTVSAVLITRPRPMEIGRTQSSGTPREVSGPSTSWEMAGSARKPIARLVTVMPTCAPDSWVERLRSATCTPAAARSPPSTARSTLLRSTVTNANSAATNIPHAATSSNEMASRIVALIVAPMLPAYVDGPGGRPRSRLGSTSEAHGSTSGEVKQWGFP